MSDFGSSFASDEKISSDNQRARPALKASFAALIIGACSVAFLRISSSNNVVDEMVATHIEQLSGSYSNFEYFGPGGCSTETAKYPGKDVTLKNTNEADCSKACASKPGCGAFESDGGSTTCYLFVAPKTISGTNGYPGVKCFKKPDKRETAYFGKGGCSTSTAKYPSKDVTLKNTGEEACGKACAMRSGCGAFESDGSSTTCYLYLAPKKISGTNGYPGVKCFTSVAVAETDKVGDFSVVEGWTIPASKEEECGGCRDEPKDWRSSTGMSCKAYVYYKYCKDNKATQSEAFYKKWGGKGKFEGIGADQACCGCGGGNKNYKYPLPLVDSAKPTWPASKNCASIPAVPSGTKYKGAEFISGTAGSVSCPEGWNHLSFQYSCVAAATALGRPYKAGGCFKDIGVIGCFLNGKPGEEKVLWNTCDEGKTSTNAKNTPICEFRGCPILNRAPVNCMDDANTEICKWQQCETCNTRCEINQRFPLDWWPINPRSRSAGDTKLYRNFYLQVAKELQPGPSWAAQRGLNAAPVSTKCVAIDRNKELMLTSSKANCDRISTSKKQLKASALYNPYSGESFSLVLENGYCGVQISGASFKATSSRLECPGKKNWLTPIMIPGMDYGLSVDNKMGGPFKLQVKENKACIIDQGGKLRMGSCDRAIIFYWRAAVADR